MPRSRAQPRRRLVVALLAALVLVPLASAHNVQPQVPHTAIAQRRGLFGFPDGPDTSTQASTTSAPASSTSSPATSTKPSSSSESQTQKSSSSDSATSTKPSDSSSAPASSTTPSSSSTQSSTSAASTTSAPSQSSAPPQTHLQTSVSTNSAGQVSTIIDTVTEGASSTSSASPSATNSGDTSSSGGVSTSTIVGLSVAGGVALIGLVTFIIWKLGRKRFSDEYGDDGEIKWPELNAHGDSPHALPTQRLNGAGFETSSEVNLVRPESRAGSFAASSADLYTNSGDPYAVPPLPHLNPNAGVPYRDDPGAGYYDAYSGPVPQTLDGEAIPMTQIPPRARSPMPPGSPAPFDGRRSPGPQAAYGPSPNLGVLQQPARVASPGPGYSVRSASPGPGYPGRASPGPQAAYGAAPSYAP